MGPRAGISPGRGTVPAATATTATAGLLLVRQSTAGLWSPCRGRKRSPAFVGLSRALTVSLGTAWASSLNPTWRRYTIESSHLSTATTATAAAAAAATAATTTTDATASSATAATAAATAASPAAAAATTATATTDATARSLASTTINAARGGPERLLSRCWGTAAVSAALFQGCEAASVAVGTPAHAHPRRFLRVTLSQATGRDADVPRSGWRRTQSGRPPVRKSRGTEHGDWVAGHRATERQVRQGGQQRSAFVQVSDVRERF